MAKPMIKFNAVPYGINGHTGYRPQLEAQDGVYDLDLCNEVVTEKRLSMSADELLHAMEMVGEVAAKKVAQDGRPRGITKLIKWNRFAKGNLESPTSPWNDSCKAYIRAQLLADAEKTIDASFVNINNGISVKLNFVTYVGAQGVQNVIKGGAAIGAYGNRMEFDAALGDAAWLEYKDADGETKKIDLTCTTSDVAHAEFAFPTALWKLEAGTPMTFRMQSRGGIEDGEVHSNKKSVIYLGGESPLKPKIASINDETDLAWIGTGDTITIAGEHLADAKYTVSANGKAKDITSDATALFESNAVFPTNFLSDLEVTEQGDEIELTVENDYGDASFTLKYHV